MKKLINALLRNIKSSDSKELKTGKEVETIKATNKRAGSGLQILYSPMEGEIINLNNVPEGAFSGRLLGDGFAIIPKGNEVYSPADGEVIVLFPTKHAVVILTEEGLEVLIHIGINTANLNGEGFNVHVNMGDKVKRGDLLIKFDEEIIKNKGKTLISPVIITNMNSVKEMSIDLGNKKVLEKVAEVIVVAKHEKV